MKFKKSASPYIIFLVSIVLFSVFSDYILLNLTKNNLVFQISKNKHEVVNKSSREMVQFNPLKKKYRPLSNYKILKLKA